MNGQNLTSKQGNAFLLPVQSSTPLNQPLDNGNVQVVVVGIIVNQQNPINQAQGSPFSLNGKPTQMQLNRNLLAPPEVSNQPHPQSSRQRPKQFTSPSRVLENTSEVARNGGSATHVPQAAHGTCQNCQNCQNFSRDKVNRPQTTNIEPCPISQIERATVRNTMPPKDNHHCMHEECSNLRRETAHIVSQNNFNRPAPAKLPAGPAHGGSYKPSAQKLLHDVVQAGQANPSHKLTGQSTAARAAPINGRENALSGGRRPQAVNQGTQHPDHVVDDRAPATLRSAPQSGNHFICNGFAPAKRNTGPGNAPRNSYGQAAPIVQAPRYHHQNAPRREQEGLGDDPRTHSALNGSTDGAGQVVPHDRNLLNPVDIQKCEHTSQRPTS